MEVNRKRKADSLIIDEHDNGEDFVVVAEHEEFVEAYVECHREIEGKKCPHSLRVFLKKNSLHHLWECPDHKARSEAMTKRLLQHSNAGNSSL
jgi:hypothetical protein